MNSSWLIAYGRHWMNNEALDLDDDIDDDINYDAQTDEVINNNYVSDEQNVRAFDCGID